MRTRYPSGLPLLAVLALWGMPALLPAHGTQFDPPERVARLAQIEGAVGLVPADSESWDEATPNRPVTTGDRIETGPDGRAAVEFDAGTAYLGGDSALEWTGLDDGSTRLDLPAGTLRLDVDDTNGAPVEVRMPDLRFVVESGGEFRFDADPDAAENTITVYAGSGTVVGTDGRQQVLSGTQAYRFTDPGLRYTGRRLRDPDHFDRWVLATRGAHRNSASREYLSPGVVGYRDLDTYGDWERAPDYGPVWYPRAVDSGWAPYRYGRWTWVQPWGWTWLDDARWGFAPFHYGRWVQVHRRWGWVPGPRHARACYAPAVVGFGRPDREHQGHRTPVTWFPLGPRDVYRPGYRASDEHYYRVNESASRWQNRAALRNARHRQDGADRYTFARDPNALSQADERDFSPGADHPRGARRADPANLGALTVRADPGIPVPKTPAPRRSVRPGRPLSGSAAAEAKQPAWGSSGATGPQSRALPGRGWKERERTPGHPQSLAPGATPDTTPRTSVPDPVWPARPNDRGGQRSRPAAMPGPPDAQSSFTGRPGGGAREPTLEPPQRRREERRPGVRSRPAGTAQVQTQPQGETRLDPTRSGAAIGARWPQHTPPTAPGRPADPPNLPGGAPRAQGEPSPKHSRVPAGAAARPAERPQERAGRSPQRDARGASGAPRRGDGHGNQDRQGSPGPGSQSRQMR